MFKKGKGNLRMFCSYVGIYAIFLTVGIPQYWGNLSVYTNSYFKKYHDSDPNIKTPWVISLFVIGCTVCTILAGYLSALIGHRGIVILGCLLLNSGVSLTYFCIQRSVMEVNLTMGLLSGMGNGLVVSTGLQIIVLFDPSSVGLIIGCIVTSVHVGSAAINQITTAYINPNNLSPNLNDGLEKYFTQPEVLNRVPTTFLGLGLINLCCHVTGILLLHPHQGTDRQNYKDTPRDGQMDVVMDYCEEKVTPSANGSLPEVTKETDVNTREVQDSTENLSPKQVLKCRQFYVLSFGYIATNYSHIMLTNYCKIYGQTRISDDRFLANLNTVLVLVFLAMRPCWGIIIDKSGLKSVLVYLSCAACVMSCYWYFTPMINRWLFFFWTIVLSCCNLGQKIIFPLATLRMFGKDYFSKNYGLVKASGIFLNLVAPSFMRCVLDSFGWFYLFFSAATANALCTILTFLTRLGT